MTGETVLTFIPGLIEAPINVHFAAAWVVERAHGSGSCSLNLSFRLRCRHTPPLQLRIVQRAVDRTLWIDSPVSNGDSYYITNIYSSCHQLPLGPTPSLQSPPPREPLLNSDVCLMPATGTRREFPILSDCQRQGHEAKLLQASMYAGALPFRMPTQESQACGHMIVRVESTCSKSSGYMSFFLLAGTYAYAYAYASSILMKWASPKIYLSISERIACTATGYALQGNCKVIEIAFKHWLPQLQIMSQQSIQKADVSHS